MTHLQHARTFQTNTQPSYTVSTPADSRCLAGPGLAEVQIQLNFAKSWLTTRDLTANHRYRSIVQPLSATEFQGTQS